MTLWQTLERCTKQARPELVAIVSRSEARTILEIRAALKDLATKPTDQKIAHAKKLLQR